MYYACAIKDVERRSRHKGRTVREVKKSLKDKSKSKKSADEHSDGVRNIEIDENAVENIRKTAEKLIKHDTAASLLDMRDSQEEHGKREKYAEEEKKEDKKEAKKKEMNEKKNVLHKGKSKKQKKGKKKQENIGHDSSFIHESKHHDKHDDTEKTITKDSGGDNEKSTTKSSEHRLEVISSKYHEIEKMLKDLKDMVEIEENRLEHDVSSELHAPGNKTHGAWKEGTKSSVASHNAETHSKTKGKQKHDRKNQAVEEVNASPESKKHKHRKGKAHKMRQNKSENKRKEIEKDSATEDNNGEEKRDSAIKENDAIPEGKTFFQRCKLAAYLYFIAVRGFGQKFYLKESPKWCEDGCVKATAMPKTKKLRRPRAVT